MLDFQGIKFKWTFRDYQQKVLDNSIKFLKDKKINIVAAPGSGKTILGLELITRLKNSCIILSPTTTIKNQWGDRFKEAFLDDDKDINDYVSFDLNNIKLLNSITYQALHSVIDKVIVNEDDKEIDYSNIDLFKEMKKNNIKTICLDEAHHLQNEWQKALEKFIKGLDKDITIISLTATPPYDASESEWNRYISVCGEIDDEIFVPKLVKERTLCPHQDYIMFNYPSLEEIESFKTYRFNAIKAIEEIGQLAFISELDKRISSLNDDNETYVYKNADSLTSIYSLLNYYGLVLNHKLVKKICESSISNELDMETFEVALSFLLKDETLTNDEEKKYVIDILKEKSLYYRNKVQLDLDEKLKRRLISSCGKLHSIANIVSSESESLKEDLRMLVLTDYIKKEEIVNVGKNVDMDNISVVSIFEEIRKNNHNDIGCLSGTLSILPIKLKEILINEYGVNKNKFKIKSIENTEYAIYEFNASNKDKVDIISKVFEDGYIKVLIGTQALLGEGWDSPCINSLILASYVGSFMLSNQMRGRAIRSYKKNKNKTANIWHLVTLEPDYIFEDGVSIKNENKINSLDYKTLTRRFDCFLAPNYTTGKIESGIERITYIKSPFNKEGVENINKSILELANDRENMAKVWDENVKDDTETVVESTISDNKLPVFSLFNTMGLLFWGFILFKCFNLIFIKENVSFIQNVLAIIVGLYTLMQIYKLGILYLKHPTKKKSIENFSKVVLKTLKELSLINKSVELNIKYNKDTKDVSFSLMNASLYEQNLFNKSIKEILSPIDEVRYVIVKKNYFGKYNYKYSFACPSCLDDNADIVNIFKFYLVRILGDLDIKYVLNQKGEEVLIKAKRNSYIKKVSKIEAKQKLL